MAKREGKSHFLGNTGASSVRLRKQLDSVFHSVYNYLTELITTPSTDPTLASLVVDAWCIDFRPEDHEFLMNTKILDIFHGLMYTADGTKTTGVDNAGQRKLRVLARLAYRYMAIQCLDESEQQQQHVEAIRPLQKFVLETIAQDLEKSINSLFDKRRELGQRSAGGDASSESESAVLDSESDPEVVAYQREEKFCYSQLILTNTLTRGQFGEDFLASPRVLRLLLFIHYAGTPELQRLAARMLRRVLPKVTPSTFSTPKLLDFLSEFVEETNNNKDNFLLRYLFEIIGRRFCITGAGARDRLTASASTSFTHNYRNGQIAFAECAEVIALLRHLIGCSTAWSEEIISATVKSLSTIPTLLDLENGAVVQRALEQPTAVYHALAALCIIGGHTEGLRVGGRMEVIATKETGTLVYYDRQSARAKVILDSNLRNVIECDAAKIRAVPELQVNLEKFPLNMELVKCLTIFLSVKPKEKPKPEPKQIEPKPAEAEPETPPAVQEPEPFIPSTEWTCGDCTLINSIADEVSNTAKNQQIN